MYTGGLRPFQPVIYLTDTIKDQLEWKGHHLKDLFDSKILSRALGEDHLLTLVALNTESDDTKLPRCPDPIGMDNLMRIWRQSAGDDLITRDTLDRIETQHTLRQQNSALETALKFDSSDEQTGIGFDVVHDEQGIYVILNREEINLLDKKQTDKMTSAIIRQVTKTFSIYQRYSDVAHSPWFKLYIEQL